MYKDQLYCLKWQSHCTKNVGVSEKGSAEGINLQTFPENSHWRRWRSVAENYRAGKQWPERLITDGWKTSWSTTFITYDVQLFAKHSVGDQVKGCNQTHQHLPISFFHSSYPLSAPSDCWPYILPTKHCGQTKTTALFLNPHKLLNFKQSFHTSHLFIKFFPFYCIVNVSIFNALKTSFYVFIWLV